MTDDLEFTGERMVPQRVDAATFWHHIYRYRFALPHVRGRRVLDIACGEGYGCRALMDGGAAAVVGVDIDETSVRHARARYGVEARAGSAESIPVGDGEMDLVVSFETIEHVPKPERFLDECARVLRRGGRLILSSPNRELYRRRNGLNPFHCAELSENELIAAVSRRFHIDGVFGQYPELAPAGLCSPRLWPFAAWVRLRGINGLRRMAQRLGASPTTVPVTYQADPARAVLHPLKGWAPLNPNIVRPRPPSRLLEFVFLLILATRKD